MSDALLVVDQIHKSFQGVAAIAGVSIEIPTGQVTGIIGPNGSGKTTLFSVISGFLKPDRGRIVWRGRNVTGWSPHRIAQAGLVRTFQQRMSFPKLTVYRNVEVAALSAGLRGSSCAEAVHKALAVVGLEEYSDQLAEKLPFGINRRLGIACALPLNPALLLLDEPAAGLSDEETQDLAGALHEVQARGQGICLVDHNMEFVTEFCRKVVVLDSGRKLAEGTPREVMANPLVAEVYLGHAASS